MHLHTPLVLRNSVRVVLFRSNSYKLLQTNIITTQKVFYNQHPPFACEFQGFFLPFLFIDLFLLTVKQISGCWSFQHSSLDFR